MSVMSLTWFPTGVENMERGEGRGLFQNMGSLKFCLKMPVKCLVQLQPNFHLATTKMRFVIQAHCKNLLGESVGGFFLVGRMRETPPPSSRWGKTLNEYIVYPPF